jgi:hypothetical protein
MCGNLQINKEVGLRSLDTEILLHYQLKVDRETVHAWLRLYLE